MLIRKRGDEYVVGEEATFDTLARAAAHSRKREIIRLCSELIGRCAVDFPHFDSAQRQWFFERITAMHETIVSPPEFQP